MEAVRSTPADRVGFDNTTDEFHLYNIAEDRFETPSKELRLSHRGVVEEMAKLLPPKHETAPNPHWSIKSQALAIVGQDAPSSSRLPENNHHWCTILWV